MPHGRSPPLLGLLVGALGIGDALVEDLGVLVLFVCVSFTSDVSRYRLTYGSVLGSLCAAALECDAVALVLEALGSDQALDLGSLGVGLCALLLGLDLAADDELANLQMAVRLNPLHIKGLAKKL